MLTLLILWLAASLLVGILWALGGFLLGAPAVRSAEPCAAARLDPAPELAAPAGAGATAA